jgi:MFS family permease
MMTNMDSVSAPSRGVGLVLGTWQLTYIVVGIAAGSITDRLGVRRAVFVGTLIMALSAGLVYFVRHLLSGWPERNNHGRRLVSATVQRRSKTPAMTSRGGTPFF